MTPSEKRFADLLTEAVFRIRSQERGTTIAIIQDELGFAVGRQGGSAIAYWRQGHCPADPEDVVLLARAIVERSDLDREWCQSFLHAAGFHPGRVQALCDELFPPGRENGGRAPALGDAPFKGLQFYDTGDAHLFFGREALTAAIFRRLIQGSQDAGSRFLAILGASGSGKSSLVRAGLIPLVARQQAWPARLFTPTANPLQALARSLSDAELGEVEALAAQMATDPTCLAATVRQRLAMPANGHAPNGHFLLLIVDQFEELFTLCQDEAVRQAFIENLMAAVTATEDIPPLLLVITLRADFYHHCAQYPSLRHMLAQHQEYIGSMSREELRQAIVNPAERYGWRFEPGLVDRILRDAGYEPGALPLLSQALHQTWRRRQGRLLTHVGYQTSGGVHEAIAHTAEAVYKALNPRQQDIARAIFLQLTRLADDAVDTRRRLPRHELLVSISQEATDMAEVERVLHNLVQARLVTADQNGVEVAHEVLIRQWPRLRRWLDENREMLRLYRRLAEAAEVWERLERDPGVLFRGAQLKQAQSWVAESAARLGNLEQAFLAESEKVAAAEEAQARELDQARARVEAQQRRARLVRRYFYTAVALLVALAPVFGWYSQNRREEARQAARLATAQSLVVQALATDDAELATLLASEAVRLEREEGASTVEGLKSLQQAIIRPFFNTTLAGHEQVVRAVAFSPDGKWLASGSSDHTIRLWNLGQPGQEPRLLPGHTEGVRSVAFSPDGSLLASASADGSVRLWPLTGPLADAGIPPTTFLPQAGKEMWAVAFSPDGHLLATAGEEPEVALWSLDGFQPGLPLPGPLARYRGHKDVVAGLAFSPDGQWLATASRDQSVRLWSVADPAAAPLVLPAHSKGVWAVAFSPDGQTLASAGSDLTVRLWPVGSLLAAGDAGIRPATPIPSAVLTGHADRVTSLSFSPDGHTLASASTDRTIHLWSLGSAGQGGSASPVVLTGHDGGVWGVAFSPDGHLIASAGEDGTIRLWDSGSGPTVLSGHTDRIFTLAFSPDGRTLASAGGDSTIRLWNQEGPTLLAGDQPIIRALAFSPDGQILASAGADGLIRLWSPEARTGLPLAQLSGHSDWVWSLAFSPDGQTLVSGSADGTVRLWPVGQALAPGDAATAATSVLKVTDWVFSVAFSPDGLKLAATGRDGLVHLWQRRRPGDDFAAEATLLDGQGSLFSLAFSPDGNTLAAANGGLFDTTQPAIFLWSVPQVLGGQGEASPWRVLRGHQDSIWSVAFSPDGRLLASGSRDGQVRLWPVARQGEDAGSQAMPFILSGHDSGVWAVAFRPDGQVLASASRDRTIRLWPVGELALLEQTACLKVHRNLTQAEWATYLPGEPYHRTCANWPAGS